MGLFGGKNSFFNKPLGVGKGSVAHNPLNAMPMWSGRAGSEETNTGLGLGDKVDQVTGKNKAADGSVKSLSVGQIRGFMDEGREKGEELTGTTSAEVGEGRADVRDRLKETLDGNSAGANALRQDQAQAQKSLRAQQAVAGQGQMNAGQQQALQRQSSRDLAGFVSNERRQALSDLSKEYRGAGGDIMRSEGQYGSILVGSQPAAQPQQANGLFTNLFGGLF